MYLKSLTLKGFKSFPDRTRLTFTPGVSVIVGPNGCGKSNVTDAVLWALGEQSPLAVRGQTMQDVIFTGGRGQSARRFAEVEVVIDNSEGRASTEFSEISIKRRIDRSGEGEYRLNGARCRLADIVDVLADANLGREMHSVISQGRVEGIVNSKPRERRLLIEEAAGMGKHRKRRRRAQLKLERTRENLERAVDIEREARSHARPLKAQAEAAERQARLAREEDELRSRIVAGEAKKQADALAAAEQTLGKAHSEQESAEKSLGEVRERRRAVEGRIAADEEERQRRAERVAAASMALERVRARAEAIAMTERELRALLGERQLRLEGLEAEDVGAATTERIAELEEELGRLDRELDARAGAGVTELAAAARAAEEKRARLEAEIAPLERAARETDFAAREAEALLATARGTAEKAAGLRATLAGELAAVEAELAAAVGAAGQDALASRVETGPGLELALSAALGERVRASIVRSLAEGSGRMATAEEALRLLVADAGQPQSPGEPPTDDAHRLLDLVEADAEAKLVLDRLLGDAWLVADLEDLPAEFRGIAVTVDGVCFDATQGELRRVPRAGTDATLSARSRREELASRLEQRRQSEERAKGELAKAEAAAGEARQRAGESATRLRDARRELDETAEEATRSAWLADRRREKASAEDPGAVRRAQLEAELAAERRHAETQLATREVRKREHGALAGRIRSEQSRLPLLARLRQSLEAVAERLERRVAAMREERPGAEGEGETIAAELRKLSQSELEVQERLGTANARVTAAEVETSRLRSRRDELAAELSQLGERLGATVAAAEAPLSEEARAEIDTALLRLARRREAIGPVNPLAQREYEEAREHLADLKAQREDLERAISELGSLIRRTDREMKEAFERTFEATARNFEEMVGELFPDGRGRLRRIEEGPRAVEDGAEETPDESGPEDDIEANGAGPRREDLGVEIEVNPAGKAMRRLSLLSGGEKSLVAIAFVFSVLLARPCPFYILDEVEAALDDVNLDRFMRLVRRFADRSQFIVVTHQKRTMDAADVLYGVSMGRDGVTKVVSRRMPHEGTEPAAERAAEEEAAAEAA